MASRRDAEKLLAEGRIRLNGAPVTHPATFINPGDIVQVNNRVVDAPDRARLWRYHKPEGLVTTHRDPEGRPTVFERLPEQLPRVVSIGRLDLNSEGLLLLTNDGGLARRLELPSNGWTRRYRVRVHGVVPERSLAGLADGVTVEGVRYGAIEAAVDSRALSNTWLSVSLREGRNREVRRVMTHLGLQVTRLIRVAYGPFQLGNLGRGEVDEITGKVLREQLPDVPKVKAPAREGGALRIIAGRWRGRILRAPPGAATRPTAERLRQAVFDMLLHAPWGGRLDGLAVLDAFAGTGALGLEALSRGAASAVFMERDRARWTPCVPMSQAARRATAQVVAADVLHPPPGRPCDLVFLDPPYGGDLVQPAVAALTAAGWIAPGALLVGETARGEAAAMDGLLAERSHGAGRVIRVAGGPRGGVHAGLTGRPQCHGHVRPD